MSELLSIRAYARRRGVSHVAVIKAAREGRITLVEGQVDPEAADRQWAANTVPQVGQAPADALAEGGHEGGDDGAVRAFVVDCARPIAGRLKGKTRPADVLRVLRLALEEIAEELERGGIV